MRLTILSAGYGFLAGIVAALVLWLMELVLHLVWSKPEPRWYIFTMIMVGGAILAFLRHWYAGLALNEQINGVRHPEQQKRRNTAFLALMAIVAVGFGGAIGPEPVDIPTHPDDSDNEDRAIEASIGASGASRSVHNGAQ